MIRRDLTSGSNPNNQNTYVTQTITPTSDRLVVVFVGSVSASTSAEPVVSGNGLTWQRVESLAFGTNETRRLACFTARGAAPSAAPITFSFNVAQLGCTWSVFEIELFSKFTPPTKTTQMGVSMIVLSPNAPEQNYVFDDAIGAVLVETQSTVTPGQGCTPIHSLSSSGLLEPSVWLQTVERKMVGSLEWTWTGNASVAAIALTHVVPAPQPPPGDPVEELVRKFEPILFFDEQEESFPSDAKRYIEHCALWRAADPFDTKSSWEQLVKAGQLAALDGEPGRFLLDPLNTLGLRTDERFLELGGWRDISGTPQPAITPQSSHPFANRDEIHSLYSRVPALQDSQFWYHAELFETGRLLTLAEGVKHPDLAAVVNSLDHPALLCYYLFFPTHRQAVVGAGVSAVEVGSYAGQWACIALLFQRPNPHDPFGEPSFVGFSGSPTLPPTPHASDREQRVTLKVAKWRPAGVAPLPDVTHGHPHFFVSPGTHSLYLEQADQEVAPFPAGKEPQDNGLWDQPYAEESDWPSDVVLFLKLSNIVGWAWALLEDVQGKHLFGSFGGRSTPDDIPPDAAPSGAGITVHPSDLTPPAFFSNPRPWRSARDLVIGQRRYDYIVDRATQPWWPGDDNFSGYGGRWGQRVEDDLLPRRAGIRFPQFWRLFLLALEEGRQNGKL